MQTAESDCGLTPVGMPQRGIGLQPNVAVTPLRWANKKKILLAATWSFVEMGVESQLNANMQSKQMGRRLGGQNCAAVLSALQLCSGGL